MANENAILQRRNAARCRRCQPSRASNHVVEAERAYYVATEDVQIDLQAQVCFPR